MSTLAKPLTTPVDSGGFPLPQGTVLEDRLSPAPIINVLVGALTTNFANHTSPPQSVADVGQGALWVEWTRGTATALEIRVRGYHTDGGVPHEEVAAVTTNGVSTLKSRIYRFDTAADLKFLLPIRLDAMNLLDVAVRGEGVLTTSVVKVTFTRAVGG